MKTVWKYEISLSNLDENNCITFQVPLGSVPLTATPSPQRPTDSNKVCVYLEIPGNNTPSSGWMGEMEDMVFMVVGTGFLVPEDTWYLGSVIIEPFAWHVYKVD